MICWYTNTSGHGFCSSWWTSLQETWPSCVPSSLLGGLEKPSRRKVLCSSEKSINLSEVQRSKLRSPPPLAPLAPPRPLSIQNLLMSGLPPLLVNLYLLACLKLPASLSLARMIVLHINKSLIPYWLDNQPALALLNFSLNSETAHPKPAHSSWIDWCAWACFWRRIVKLNRFSCVGNLNVLHADVIWIKLEQEQTGQRFPPESTGSSREPEGGWPHPDGGEPICSQCCHLPLPWWVCTALMPRQYAQIPLLLAPEALFFPLNSSCKLNYTKVDFCDINKITACIGP